MNEFDKTKVFSNINIICLVIIILLQFFGHWIEVEKTPSIFDFIMRCLEIDYLGKF